MATVDLLEDNPNPSRAEMEDHLGSNICRCTGYQNIYKAVDSAAEKMRGEE
jgi:carbon-monoxide dehydrogenase small subunit